MGPRKSIYFDYECPRPGFQKMPTDLIAGRAGYNLQPAAAIGTAAGAQPFPEGAVIWDEYVAVSSVRG